MTPIAQFVGHGANARSSVRTERVLAVGRAFLTVTALVAIYLDPNEPTRLQSTTYGVLLSYATYSLIVLALVNAATRMNEWQALTLHGLDMLWTSVLTVVSEGPVSPFFLFFLFVVLAAAYRWQFRETLGTAVITVTVYLLETALAAAGPWHATWLQAIAFDLNSTILRVAYLLLTGALLGYIAQQEKESRRELAAIAGAARQPHISLGLGGSVASLSRAMQTTFGAAAVVFVVREVESGRVLRFQLDRDAAHAGSNIRRMELTAEHGKAWLFPDVGRAWHGTIAPGAGRDTILRSTEPDAWRLTRTRGILPEVLGSPGAYTAVSAVNLGLAGEWQARIYLYDPAEAGGIERRLHFMEDLAEHLTPGLTNVFLLRRLRARAGAAERTRVARELHDGSIQALFGIEMKIEAIRRESQGQPPDVDAELADIQQMIRGEVHSLRELMQALRPIELESPEQLQDLLAALIERFRRDTGISARFLASDEPLVLPPDRALELVRIVQEALVNVRKHSHAMNVLVRITVKAGEPAELVIEDDGRGFGFDGRLSAWELDEQRLGPAIIKERARLAGANLVIDSTPGAGSRLELTFPSEA